MKFYEIDNALKEAIQEGDSPVRLQLAIDRCGYFEDVFEQDIRVSPKLNTTYWQAKVVVYNSNPYGICS
jgi:hypothetical protein